MALVLTSCTNRKRLPSPGRLAAHTVKPGALESVVAEWADRLGNAKPSTSASDLYCGRAFRQAQGAAERLNAVFQVVSAGLGLVPAKRMVPSYRLTVAPGAVDNILDRIVGSRTPSEWWRALNQLSPFGGPVAESARHSRGTILVALSGNYLSMIAEDLLALPETTRSRLRVFTLSPRSSLPHGLGAYVMPYDSRFDGEGSPTPGTRCDFAQRALAHFVKAVLEDDPRGSLEAHAHVVEKFLSRLPPPKPISRAKASDDEILVLIHRHWSKVSGQSSRMLRYLRDDLRIACEQSRFRDLFRAVRDAQT